MTTIEPASSPDGGFPAPRVIRVSKATIAAARAQVTILTKLGRPIPDVVSRIAELKY